MRALRKRTPTQWAELTRLLNGREFVSGERGGRRSVTIGIARHIQDWSRSVKPSQIPAHEGVYFIQCMAAEMPIKIGVSDSIQKRLAHFRGSYPWPLEFLTWEEGGYDLERTLHQQFSKHRLGGEWFLPTEPLLARIHERRTWLAANEEYTEKHPYQRKVWPP